MFSKLMKELENGESLDFLLKYWDSAARIHIVHKADVYDHLIKFLCSHFETAADGKVTIGDIYFSSYGFYLEKIKKEQSAKGSLIPVRKSSAERFNLNAWHILLEGYQIYDFDKLDTALMISKEEKKIYLFASDASEIVLAEFIRDLYIKDQEKQGSFILHAAAVEKNGSVYAVCGEKGAGKSTVLYDLVFEHGYSMYSGDKLIVKIINQQFYVKGWPDYPHLGIGTIRNNRRLNAYFKDWDFSKKNASEKILFDPNVFYQELALLRPSEIKKLTAFIFPEFCENKEFQIIGCSEIKEVAVRNLEFKEDFKLAGWYDYFNTLMDKREKQKRFREIAENYHGLLLKGNIHKNTGCIELDQLEV